MKLLIDFPYRHVLVLGLAKSGTAAANLLLDQQIRVRVNELHADPHAPEIVDLKSKGAELILHSHPLSALDQIDLIVKNPGISYNHPLLVEADKRSIPIITEIELAANIARENKTIAITGSNGKTTTTTLVETILKQDQQSVKLAGNIGVVATDIARTLTKKDAFVLELSSFQLMGTQHFRPHIAALLNLFEAHLDYHGSLEKYIEAKANIFKNQSEEDFLIYNADDKRITELLPKVKAELVPFSIRDKHIRGGWIDEQSIYFHEDKIIEKTDIALVGEHNIQNILAAICICRMCGVKTHSIQQVLRTFTGVEHRLQFVKEVHERAFYNDSKATNILATQKALQAFKQPIILLAGGLDRGNTYEDLLPYLKNVKAMVLFGETKEKLSATAEIAKIDTVMAKDVQEATRIAYQLSEKGDIILLSPACASWDQYKTFEERGNMFVQSVHILS